MSSALRFGLPFDSAFAALALCALSMDDIGLATSFGQNTFGTREILRNVFRVAK